MVTGRPRLGAEPEIAPSLGPGDTIGRFELRERIGQGGMGVVFVARDPALARDVAIKLLRPDTAVRLDHTRLLREAQALGQLQHPNVVSVHDVGSHDGMTYLAMDYVRGRPLRTWIHEETPTHEDIAKMLAAAGDGIAAAHAVGLLHRDIKPANVLVADDGRAVVVDFGLARAADETKEATMGTAFPDRLLDTSLTDSNLLIGTPRYMAPELLSGKPASASSDQFAFAVTLFEALFDYPPFPGRTPRELFRSMTAAPPLLPPTLPPLQHVLRRGLSALPEARFPSMAELMTTLRTAVGFRRRRVRRRKIAVASLVGVLALSGGGYAAWESRPPGAAVVSEVDRLSQAATNAAARGRFVYPSPDNPAEPTALAMVLELEQLDARLAPQRARELRLAFGRTLTELGDRYWPIEPARGFALDYYIQALVFDPDAEVASMRTGLTPGQRLALRKRAEHAGFSRGELVAAEPLIALAEESTKDRRKHLRALVERRKGEHAAFRHDELVALLEEMPDRSTGTRASPTKRSAAPKKAPPPPPPPEVDDEGSPGAPPPKSPSQSRPKTASEIASIVATGTRALDSRNYEEAEQAFRRALASSPRNAAALIGLSDVFFERSDYARALRYAKKATAASPMNARYRLKLGDAHFKVDQYKEAKAAYLRAKNLGHPQAQARLDRLAKALGQDGGSP
jgi:serine/threonine protein kinase/tetratricopeptide (TPR) repeat protein